MPKDLHVYAKAYKVPILTVYLNKCNYIVMEALKKVNLFLF